MPASPLLLLAALAVAPARAGEEPPDASPSPVEGRRDALGTVTFTRLVVPREHVDLLGPAIGDYRVQVLVRLRELGYPALGAENVLFGKDEGDSARFQIGGHVLGLERRVSQGRRGVEVQVEWQVYDTVHEQVIYVLRSRGHATATPGERESDVAARALDGAWTSLLSRPAFVRALRDQDEGQVPVLVQDRPDPIRHDEASPPTDPSLSIAERYRQRKAEAKAAREPVDPWPRIAVASASVGLVAVGGTWAFHLADPDVTPLGWSAMKATNAAGWVALGAGTGLFVWSRSRGRQARVEVGPSHVGLHGQF